MGIWKIIRKNFGARPRTRKPQEVVPHPAGFRGVLTHESSLCTACKTCAYVCSPSAITFDESGSHTVAWQYFAGQCTYCGRCAAYCPTGALNFQPQSVSISADLHAYRVSHPIEYAHCSRCGRSFIPLPAGVLVKMYGDPLPAEINLNRHLCEECRNRVATRGLKEAVYGQLAHRAGDLIDRQKIQKPEEDNQ